MDKRSATGAGTLEFYFEHEAAPRVVSDVLWEDVYAAYEILFPAKSNYQKGKGIGIMSAGRISGKDHERNVFIHPATEYLELGRSLARADVLLRVRGKLLTHIQSKQVIADKDKWSLIDLINTCTDDIGWKFTDAGLMVKSTENSLYISNNEGDEPGSGIINFSVLTSIYGGYEDLAYFNSIFPLLADNYYDFYRLDKFARTLGLLRWARNENARFLNKPSRPPMVKCPSYLKIHKDKGTIEIVDNYR